MIETCELRCASLGPRCPLFPSTISAERCYPTFKHYIAKFHAKQPV